MPYMKVEPKTLVDSPWRSIRPEPPKLLLDALEASISARGILCPLLFCTLSGKQELIDGHKRRDAALKLGLEFVPCIDLGFLTKTETQTILITLAAMHDEPEPLPFVEMVSRVVEAGAKYALITETGLALEDIDAMLQLAGEAPEYTPEGKSDIELNQQDLFG